MYSVVGSDGQVYGPVDIQTLKQWVAEGRVGPETNLIDPMDGRVLKASTISAISAMFPQKPPAAPPAQHASPQPQVPGPQGQAPVQINNYVGMAPPGYPMALGPGAPKSRLVAGLLALFLGGLGIHQFYLGKNGLGVAMLLITVLTCGYGVIITGLWALIDAVMCFTGGTTDAQGRQLY